MAGLFCGLYARFYSVYRKNWSLVVRSYVAGGDELIKRKIRTFVCIRRILN